MAASFITQERLCLRSGGGRQAVCGSVRRGRPRSLGRGKRALVADSHHLQGASIPHGALLRSADVRRTLGGRKCMYKLEPVVADGGELIIYAPHLHEVSEVHGKLMRGDRLPLPGFLPRAVGQIQRLSHRGTGPLDPRAWHRHHEDGVETPRVQRDARHAHSGSGVPADQSRLPRSGYDRSPILTPNREDEGILYVPKAGERLFHLKNRPAWAGGQ